MELLYWSAVLLRANFSLLEKKLKPLLISIFDFLPLLSEFRKIEDIKVEWVALKKPKDPVTFVTEPLSLRRC